MTRARPQALSLNGGEVDDEAIARSDIDSYANKAAIYENALPAVKGGLYRLPGTEFIGRALPIAGADGFSVVRPWRYSRAQAVTVEFVHGQLRLVYDTGYIQTGAAAATFDAGGWNDDSDGGGAIGGSPDWPDPAPPPDGGGTGDPGDDTHTGHCVASTSWMPDGRRAGQVNEGDQIEALSEDLSSLRWARVQQVTRRVEPCVRLRMASGELDVSCPTRLVQPDGSFVRADRSKGALIRCRDAARHALRWEVIEDAAPIGDVEVTKISAGEVNYAASRTQDVFFYPHNLKSWPL